MRILIVCLNYTPEPVGIAVYTSGLAEALAKRGHQLSVIAGQPYYPGWKLAPGFRQSYSRIYEGPQESISITRCPHYIPAEPTGLKRILHHLSFAATSLFPVLLEALRRRPDVVFAVAPSLLSAPSAALVVKIIGRRSWLHIQDFEVEAAQAVGLVNSDSAFMGFSRRFEGWVMRRFDRVSSISPAMCEKLPSKGVDAARVVKFRNWGNLEAIRPLDRPSAYRAEWGIETEHVALYSGNIANKQGIEIVAEAAKRLEARKDLTFVICGEGPNLKLLKSQAEGLENVQFHPLQPFERMNELMGLASVHLLPQAADAADLVLPSKLINMLASGRPVVVTAADNSGLAREATGCGVVVEPGDSGAFATAIETLLDDAARHMLTSKRALGRTGDCRKR